MLLKKNRARYLFVLLVWVLLIIVFQYDKDNPPERATVTALKVGYYTSENGWVFSAPIPTSERELQVCGLMQKSIQDTLLFTITNPSDKNDFLRLDKSFYDIQPGEFCIRLHLLGKPPPGEYTLWVMDARRNAGELSIEFEEE